MAGKRAATSELNHLNWNDAEEEESNDQIGSFETAPADELKNRVIKKARRKITTASDSSENKSIFSGFSGFKTAAPAPSTTQYETPFSFLNKISSSTTPEHKKIQFKEKSETTTLNGTHKPCKDYSKLKNLNQALLEWIKKHVDENPICILTPIFKDYENYLSEILEDNDSKPENEKSSIREKSNLSNVSSTSSSKLDSEKPKLFSFASKDIQSENKKAEKTTPTKSFSFGTTVATPKPSTTDETGTSTATSIFANIKPSSSTNMFGSASSGFSFGKTDNTGSSLPGFSFTNSKPFSFGGSVASQQALPTEDKKSGITGEDEENDEPPKNDFKAVVEEDSVYSKRCKVFVKSDGNYADRGVGTLYLKPIKESGKTQLLVRADTNLGNILLNFILSDGLPSQRMGKNNVMIVCIPTPESDPKPTSILLRVKSGEEADELLENINKYKK